MPERNGGLVSSLVRAAELLGPTEPGTMDGFLTVDSASLLSGSESIVVGGG